MTCVHRPKSYSDYDDVGAFPAHCTDDRCHGDGDDDAMKMTCDESDCDDGDVTVTPDDYSTNVAAGCCANAEAT